MKYIKVREFRINSDITLIGICDPNAPLQQLREVSNQPHDLVRIYTLGAEWAGYSYYLAKQKEIEIVRVFVKVEFRRKGVGSFILGDLKKRLGEKRNRLVARVPEEDLAAQLFFRASGLRVNEREFSPGGELYVFEFFY